jgi:hypothetical protein
MKCKGAIFTSGSGMPVSVRRLDADNSTQNRGATRIVDCPLNDSDSLCCGGRNC